MAQSLETGVLSIGKLRYFVIWKTCVEILDLFQFKLCLYD